MVTKRGNQWITQWITWPGVDMFGPAHKMGFPTTQTRKQTQMTIQFRARKVRNEWWIEGRFGCGEWTFIETGTDQRDAIMEVWSAAKFHRAFIEVNGPLTEDQLRWHYGEPGDINPLMIRPNYMPDITPICLA